MEFREIRETGEDYVLEGVAAVFDTWTDLGPFQERIARGAFTDAIPESDVRFLLNHDGLPLARTASGTMRVWEDERGLLMRARLDRTDPDVHRIVPKIQRGDLSQFSFAFRVGPDGQEWDRQGNKRTITRVAELFDVSLVTDPAYPTTEVLALRSRQDFQTWTDESHARETLLRGRRI
jgi:HK97 family phage prohead protease